MTAAPPPIPPKAEDDEEREGYEFMETQVLDGWLPEDIGPQFTRGMARYLTERAERREAYDAEDDD